MDTGIRVARVRRFRQFGKNYAGDLFFNRGVGLQRLVVGLPGILHKLPDCAVCIQADENADFFNFLQNGLEFMKAADKEIADQSVKLPGDGAEQYGEVITQGFAGLFGDEGDIRRHDRKFNEDGAGRQTTAVRLCARDDCVIGR